MEVTHMFSCLVSPGKHEENGDELHGISLPLKGDLYSMLRGVFDAAPRECKIPIRFRGAEDGTQQNDVRDILIQLLQKPSLEFTTELAVRLSQVTTKRSGLGLIFVIVGRNGDATKCVISRFPANQGVLAETKRDTLEIEFVQRVFMKSVASYKAALYVGSSLEEDFWDGSVVDKQLTYGPHSAADYWIKEFLASEFRTTGPAGSRRLAIAMREAAKAAPDLETKQQIVSAVSLVPGFAGKPVSVALLFDQFNLPDKARLEITKKLPGEHVIEAMFKLEPEEFIRNASFRSVELDNGGIMTAPTETFDGTFDRDLVDEAKSRYRYSTVGCIVDHRVKTRR